MANTDTHNLMIQEWHEMFNSIVLNLLNSGDFLLAGCKKLRQPVRAFCANCRRVLFMQRVPKSLFEAGRLFQVAESIAARDVDGDPFKYARQYCASPSIEVAKKRDDIITGDAVVPFTVAARTEHADLLAAAERHGVLSEIELLMSMQLMSAWTVFETFFGDVIKAAVFGGKAPRLDAKGKPIEVEKFYAARFLGGNGIISTCERAFHADGREIVREIKNKNLRALFAVRNLIAHKAGRCDKMYLDQRRTMRKLIPKLRSGQQLKLDGHVMRSLIPPAFSCCLRFFSAVDAWLVSHPH